MNWLKRSLLFGLSLTSCATMGPEKVINPVYVKPIVIEYEGENLICHKPEEYYLIMKEVIE